MTGIKGVMFAIHSQLPVGVYSPALSLPLTVLLVYCIYELSGTDFIITWLKVNILTIRLVTLNDPKQCFSWSHKS